MKKVLAGILLGAMILSTGAVGVLAGQGHHGGGGCHGGQGKNSIDCTQGTGCHYTDADQNGICDICGLKNGRHFIDADGDGLCDNCGRKNGRHYSTSNRGRKTCKGHGKYSCTR